MSPSLLRTRRFLPLFLTQALGALNDNLFKNALVVLVVFRAEAGGAALVAVAGGLFILPYLLFSAVAGQLADRLSKSRLIRISKAAEVLLMLAAGVGFLMDSVPLLFAVLFGLGTQAAFFGPLKYGILPEHLAEGELVRGNALIEAGTFLAILAGTIAGGALIGLAGGPGIVSAAGLLVAAAGLVSAFAVPYARPAAPDLRVGLNIITQTRALLRGAHANRSVWLSLLGLSWFWTVGATFLAEFPVMAKNEFNADSGLITLLLTAFVVGVGAGSMLAGRLARGEVSARFVPFAALLLSLFTWGFAALAGTPGAAAWVSPPAMLLAPSGLLAIFCLTGAAACGGMFSVPLYAIIQDRAGPAERARMIAANNVMNALFMVIGAGAIAAMAASGMRPGSILKIAAALNLLVAIQICRLLPADVLRTVFQWYFHALHGVRLAGLQHMPPTGTRAVIVSNHQSFLDGCLLGAFLPGRPVFVIDTHQARRWYVRAVMSAVEVLTVDSTNPFSAREMVHAVRSGRPLVIFPEGRITRTGALMKVYDGAGMVADRADAVVVPVRIDGLQRSRWSRLQGLLPLRWFPPVSLTMLPPVRLGAGLRTVGHRRRQELGAALLDVMIASEFRTRDIDRSLWTELVQAAGVYGLKKPIAEDLQFAPLTYKRLILGAAVLGRALAGISRDGERVGVLLPNANGAVVTFFALQAFRRVPAMLNFSAGADGMLGACRAAAVRTVLSSRAFVQKAKLGAAVEHLGQQVRVVWLEDIRAGLGLRAKLRGLREVRRPGRLPGAAAGPGDPAVILFTSGSEGTPKGVALSHRNLLANLAQIRAVVDINPADRLMNAMPMFHSFGLTGGTLLPLLSGIKVFFYPSPLHYRTIPEVTYGTDATITFGTDTFLAGWARYANPYDQRTVRYVVAGAERLRDETR
ncbi:MAG: MFS transporter, partial [Acetobacteraceae bacterium]|nr:MFS transporter [Acetobacteraceae bacterium]